MLELEQHRDAELADRREKRRKAAEEEAAKKAKEKEEGGATATEKKLSNLEDANRTIEWSAAEQQATSSTEGGERAEALDATIASTAGGNGTVVTTSTDTITTPAATPSNDGKLTESCIHRNL